MEGSCLALAARVLGDRAALRALSWTDLADWGADEAGAAYAAFRRSAAHFLAGRAVLRAGLSVPHDLADVFRVAIATERADAEAARAFFEMHFSPFRIEPAPSEPHGGRGFLTGYYEPEVQGALERSREFTEPILARPDDLVTFAPGDTPLGKGLSAGLRNAAGEIDPCPTRAEIEAGALKGRARPLLWLRDGIEAFMIHVQGSARVRLPDGRVMRLTYAGRNGRPYSSIGRQLVERGEIAAADMSLDRLKQWVRTAGQAPGEAGRRLMQKNESFIFFGLNDALDPNEGPIGAEGVPLERLRSIAVDRNLWPYGLPFWIEAELPWRSVELETFRRLMIAQDTGSAILGPARADLFFGTGPDAGRRAGGIRHPAAMTVLLPRGGRP